MIKAIKLKPLVLSILLAEGVGLLGAFLVRGQMQGYQELNMPPLAPPGVVFPIAWTMLFLLMGISAYLVYESCSEKKSKALFFYVLQLIVNFLWSPIFFGLNLYLLAFLWIILLFVLVVITTRLFYKIDKTAGILMIPYILWLLFAAYLNFSIILLN